MSAAEEGRAEDSDEAGPEGPTDTDPGPLPTRRALGIALALLTAALFGTIPIAGKVALTGIPAFALPFGLLALTGVFLAAGLAVARPDVLATLRDEPPRFLILMGLALGLNHVLYYVGLSLTTATATEVIIQLAPLFLVAFGVVLFKEALGPLKALGTALAVAGVLVISWNGETLAFLYGSGRLLGNLLVASAALAWAVYAVGQKVANRRHPPQAVLVAVYLTAAAVALPVAVFNLPSAAPSIEAWAGLVFLALATVVAFGAFAEALEHAPASTLAVVTTTAPLFTIAYVLATKAFLPGIAPPEDVTLLTWLGAVLVVVGVAAVSREREELPVEAVEEWVVGGGGDEARDDRDR